MTIPINEDLFCPNCAHKGMKAKPATHSKGSSPGARFLCPACRHRTRTALYTAPQILPKVRVTEIKKYKRFIITSAVNDTELVTGAHETFKRMAKELDAAYCIIPGRYRNPNMMREGIHNFYTWPKEILDYVVNADVQLNKNLWIRGTWPIQYTAVNPLAGLNHSGDTASEIFGHPQIAMEMVPTPADMSPKMLHTTGSISVKNYSSSKDGKKAEFHHVIGALFIEIEGSKFWPTQLRYDGEGVYLYDKYYTPKSTKSSKVEAVVFGDTHKRFLRKKQEESQQQIANKLKPKTRVYHDLHDHHIGSHHNEKDKIFLLAKSIQKEFSIRDELMLSVKFLEDKPDAVIVDSNHNRHLDQWFSRFEPKRDPVNYELYVDLSTWLKASIENGGSTDLFELFVKNNCKTPVTFVDSNKRYDICGIDVSQHGDRGPNGARGSAKTFAKTGYKTIVGHAHTPRIEKGCWQVGTSADDMFYIKGYSSQAFFHCVIYSNGKRGMISTIGDKLSPMMRK